MSHFVHIEIHATDPKALSAFYEKSFDWKFTYIAPLDYYLFNTGDGSNLGGGMPKRVGPKPAEGAAVNAFVCSIGVASLDDALKRALDNGATVALPKNLISGVGWQVYVKDPDGNILGIHQPLTPQS
jgi:predicted enzyme related to lactoylglutathione lyase